MTTVAAKSECRKCRARLVLTREGNCMICGCPAEPATEAGRSAPKPMKAPIPFRPMPSPEDPAVREDIVRSYHVYGLVQTGEDFGIKPSTLVLRLKKWGVDLHGRGWKPDHVRPRPAAHGAAGAPRAMPVEEARRQVLDSLASQIDELERVVGAAAQSCGRGETAKGYHAGRLEMLQVVRMLVRHAQAR